MRSAVTNVAYTKPVLLAVRGRARLSQRAGGTSSGSDGALGTDAPYQPHFRPFHFWPLGNYPVAQSGPPGAPANPKPPETSQ